MLSEFTQHIATIRDLGIAAAVRPLNRFRNFLYALSSVLGSNSDFKDAHAGHVNETHLFWNVLAGFELVCSRVQRM